MRQKFTLITLGVADVARAEAFYTALGWQKSPKSMDDLILFDLGGILFSLYPREALAEDIGIAADGHGFGGATLSHNAPSKADVDAIMVRAAACGATIVKEPQEVFWGGYSGYFRDPDGHYIEVAYNPFWPLDDAGNVVLG